MSPLASETVATKLYQTPGFAVVGGVPQTTQGAHANLLAELSQCLNAFQAAMDQIGVLHSDSSFAQRVTAFTASDFGRTFPSNRAKP